MRIAANINDQKKRKEQFDVLKDVFQMIKDREDLDLFLDSFLTESEKAYLGQRLNIMRMLVKNFDYTEVKDKIGASNSTISHAQKCLDKGGAQLEKVILKYKFRRKNALSKKGNPFKAHYPGSIQL